MTFLGSQTLTIKRNAPGSYDSAGEWVEGAESTLTIQGVVQPLTPREIQQLDEGWRARARYSLITTTELQGVSVAGEQSPYRVVYKGRDLLVFGDDDFSEALPGSNLQHHEYVLVAPEVGF